MAKIGLTMGGFTLIPEGTHVLMIKSVNDEKLETFGKLEIVLVDRKGRSHTERYNFINSDGQSTNDTALWYFSQLARAALNLNAEDTSEIDPKSLIGHFIRCEVTHESVESNRKPGTYNDFSRLGKNKEPADGFDEAPAAPAPAAKKEPVEKPATQAGKAGGKKPFDLNSILG